MRQNERAGLFFALAGFAVLSLGDAVIKSMAGLWSPVAVAALRFTIAAVGLGAFLLLREGAAGFRLAQPRAHTDGVFAIVGEEMGLLGSIGVVILLAFLAWRGADPADDVLFAAHMTRGTTLWGYTRVSDKDATEAWAQTDQIRCGIRYTIDHLQDPESPGWLSYQVPARAQAGWTFRPVGPVV